MRILSFEGKEAKNDRPTLYFVSNLIFTGMFSLFSRSKITSRSIRIPDFGWPVTRDEPSIVQWINPEQTVAISVNYFALKPDVPSLRDIDALRAFFRNSITGINGGIIDLDIVQLNNVPTVKTIFKIPQEHGGITYLGSLTVLYRNCSFVLKIQAAETGTTGMRDTIIANRLIQSGEIAVDNSGYTNWFADPFAPDFREGTLMNRSEKECYDAEFPNHPLTLSRKILARFEKETLFGPGTERLRPVAF